MKKGFFICLMILTVMVCEGWAIPPLPHTFYGTVKKDGANVPDGTQVTAWIGGSQVALASSFTSSGNTVYTFNIQSDDPDTPAKDGGAAGDAISFKVGTDSASQTATFTSGSTTSLNLTVTGQYTLTININPIGAGSVAKNPNQSAYSFGTTVSITATPASGYTFGSWSGDASGTSNPASVTLNGNKTVTASFNAITETVSSPGKPSGTASGLTGTSYAYSSSGSTSSLGHSVEYQFDWRGDGSSDLSAWGASSQSKTWSDAGTYQVRARARCVTHTGAVSGWSAGLPVTITQPTVSFTVTTNPAGLQIGVDGSSYISPKTFNWVPGTSHAVTANSPVSGEEGIRYSFTSWSDGGAQTHTIKAPESPLTYTATYATQYRLTTAANPAAGGTVNPQGSTWYNSGQSVQVSATAASGYSFSEWTGGLSGATNPTSLAMTEPRTVTAAFLSAGSLSVSPSDGLTASGALGGPFTPTSKTYTLENKGGIALNWSVSKTQGWMSVSTGSGSLPPGGGVSVTVSINSNANGLAAGTYTDTVSFTNSTNGSGNTTRSSGLTVTAAPQPFTVNTNISGLEIKIDDVTYPAPQTVQWAPGTSHKLGAPSPQKVDGGKRYGFSSWSDGGNQTHTVNAPSTGTTYTANYKLQNKLKVTLNPAGAGTVELKSSKTQSGMLTVAPDENWFDENDLITITLKTNPGYAFSNWTGDFTGGANPASLQMTGPKEVVANFTVVEEAVSTPSKPNGYVGGVAGVLYSFSTGKSTSNYGDPVEYQFDWKGDGSDLSPWGPASQTKSWGVTGTYQVKARARCATHNTVVSDWSGFLEVTISESTDTYTITTDPPGLVVSVDGSSYTSPVTFKNWASGSSHTLSVLSPQSGTSGTRYVFSSWSDGGASLHGVTVTPANSLYVARFTTEHRLATSAVPSEGGAVSPKGENWYPNGQSVSMVATPNEGFFFGGWSGDLSGMTAQASVVMNGPKTIKANFTTHACQLTVNVEDPVSGSVMREPEKPVYECGEQVVLTAKANPGYAFKNWSGDATGETHPVTLTVNGVMAVTAHFAAIGSASLEVSPVEGMSVSGMERGPFTPTGQNFALKNLTGNPLRWKISKRPKWINVTLTSGTLPAGGTVEITASLNLNSVNRFKKGSYEEPLAFSTGTKGNENVITRSIRLTVTPAIRTHTVTTEPEGLQIVVDGATYTSPQTFDWEAGSSHTLSTPSPQNDGPESKHTFSSWSNRKPQAQTVVAPFTATTYKALFKTFHSLTTSADSPEGGTVTPGGTTWYVQGEKVSVTAKAASGYQFLNWSGDGAGSSNPMQITMNGPVQLVASFGLKEAPTDPPEKELPLIGALESPSDGKKVLGVKTIYGWTLDGEGISKIRFFVDGNYVCDIPYGGLREDLKEAYPDYPNAEKGGFALIWNYSSLPQGLHAIQIDVYNKKGDVLSFMANVEVLPLDGEMIAQVGPNDGVIQGARMMVNGEMKVYDLKVEWSAESQSFEITDLSPR